MSSQVGTHEVGTHVCKVQDQWRVRMSLLWLKKRARCTRCHKVKGEVAVTAGFVPFKVPGSPVVEKTVLPSRLSVFVATPFALRRFWRFWIGPMSD